MGPQENVVIVNQKTGNNVEPQRTADMLAVQIADIKEKEAEAEFRAILRKNKLAKAELDPLRIQQILNSRK